MLGRRLAPLVVALAIVLTAAGCTDQSAAVQVGSERLSESELLDELRAYADNDAFVERSGLSEDAIRGESRSSFSQEFTGGIVEQRIQFMLISLLFADEGLELTESDRAGALDQLTGQLGEAFEGFPQSYQDQLIEDYARLVKVQTELGQSEFQDAFREAAESTDIRLSSRYGSLDTDALLTQDPAVIPPDGPAPAPGSTDEAEASDGE